MMHIHLVFVGKTSFPEVELGIQRYLDRLVHYVPTMVHHVKAQKISAGTPVERIREQESENILKLIGKRDYLIVWDERGQQLDSTGFARFLERVESEGWTNVWMVIGGPLGVSPRLLDQASCVLSLSKMTFPHDLARLLTVEQLYRGFTILKGEPYHK